MIRYLPQWSILQLLMLAGYCALLLSFLRTSWLAPRDEFVRMTFSPDSRLLLTSGSDGAIKVWNLEHRWPLPKRLTIEGTGIHQDPHAIGFLSNTNVFVITQSANSLPMHTVNLLQWDAGQNRSIANLAVPAADWQCAVGLAGQVAVTHAAGKNLLTLWDLTTGAKIREIRPANEVLTFDLSSDGRTLSVLGGPRARPRVDLWDVASGQQRHLTSDYDLHSAFFTMHDEYLVVVSDQAVSFWDLKTLQESAQMPIRFPLRRLHVTNALSSDAQRFVYSSDLGELLSWDLTTCQTERWESTVTHHQPLAMALAPDGSTLATARGTSAMGIALRDPTTGDVLRVIGKWNRKRSIVLFCLSFLGWSFVWSRTRPPLPLPAAPQTHVANSLRGVRRSLMLIVGSLLTIVAIATTLATESELNSARMSVIATVVLIVGTLLTARGFRQVRAAN